jgi:hypothetical protein
MSKYKFPSKILTKEELEKLPTKRILAYKKKYFKCEERHKDMMPDEYMVYLESYFMLKDILAGRENVEK